MAAAEHMNKNTWLLVLLLHEHFPSLSSLEYTQHHIRLFSHQVKALKHTSYDTMLSRHTGINRTVIWHSLSRHWRSSFLVIGWACFLPCHTHVVWLSYTKKNASLDTTHLFSLPSFQNTYGHTLLYIHLLFICFSEKTSRTETVTAQAAC